jgi:hypothetical protein
MAEKILARHPENGKQGVKIDKAKYELVRDAILETLEVMKEITFGELADVVDTKLRNTFDGSIIWYVTTVKLDLEARRVIECVRGTSPQRIRLKE